MILKGISILLRCHMKCFEYQSRNGDGHDIMQGYPVAHTAGCPQRRQQPMLLLLLDKAELTNPSGLSLLYLLALRIQSGLVRSRYS